MYTVETKHHKPPSKFSPQRETCLVGVADAKRLLASTVTVSALTTALSLARTASAEGATLTSLSGLASATTILRDFESISRGAGRGLLRTGGRGRGRGVLLFFLRRKLGVFRLGVLGLDVLSSLGSLRLLRLVVLGVSILDGLGDLGLLCLF